MVIHLRALRPNFTNDKVLPIVVSMSTGLRDNRGLISLSLFLTFMGSNTPPGARGGRGRGSTLHCSTSKSLSFSVTRELKLSLLLHSRQIVC